MSLWTKSLINCSQLIKPNFCLGSICRVSGFSKMTELRPPCEVRGLKKLDRSLFSKKVLVPCLRVKAESIQILMKTLKKYFLKLPNFKPIRPALAEECLNNPTNETTHDEREVFLNPKVVSKFCDLEAEDQDQLSQFGIGESCFNMIPLQLSYDNWSADDVISAVLPEGVETAAGFTLAGHIVHLNLRDHLLDYKYVIGEVLLDKIKAARTVVNKVDTIDNTFRVFNMEVLAGESDFVTEVKEKGCLFKFDFSTVYWNSRLSAEHERVVKKLSYGDILYDVFAGVGPFSIPAAKKKCEVLANDLNPESFKWLQHNAKINKVDKFIKAFNKDGADFLREDVKEHILHYQGDRKMHIVMNLPAIAVTFLHVFKGFFTADQIKQTSTLPTVHVYCFVKGKETDSTEMAKELVENSLNHSISETVDDIFFVRNVAPNKNMMRVSFRLSESIVLGAKRKLDYADNNEQDLKKVKEIV